MAGGEEARYEPPGPGLQPERTALAWRRTALALVAGALLEVRVLPPLLGGWARLPAAVAAICGCAVLVASHRRYRRHTAAATTEWSDRSSLEDGLLPCLLTVVTMLTGGVLLIALAFRPG